MNSVNGGTNSHHFHMFITNNNKNMGCNCKPKNYSVSMGCCQPVLGPVEMYYTKPEIDRMIEEIEESGCCITAEEVESAITSAMTIVESEIPSLSGYATEEWVENKGYLTEHQHLKTINGQSLVGDGDIEIGTGGTIDLSNYYTTAQTINLVESAVTVVEGEIPSLSGYATEQWVEDKHYITGVDLSDYALKSEIPTVPTSNTAFTNDAGYIANVDLSDYVTYDELPDLGELATKQWVIDQNYAKYSEFIQYITNLQQQIDSLKQQISGCCGSTGETFTRWITMTGENAFCCSGTTKLTKEAEQQSDDGIHWTYTGNYRTGSTVLEENSIACGYGDCAYCCEVKLSGDSTVYTPYTWVKYYNGVLNRSTTKQGFFETNKATITHLTFNECVKKVASETFYIAGYEVVEYIDIPATVTEIGESAFNLGGNRKFTTMVVRNTVPPQLSKWEDNLDHHGSEGPTFKSANNNFKIYVPDASVNTYKTTPRWSNYADIIYPISQLS